MSRTIHVRAVVEVPDEAIEAVVNNFAQQHGRTFSDRFDRFNLHEARDVAATAVAAVLHWQEAERLRGQVQP